VQRRSGAVARRAEALAIETGAQPARQLRGAPVSADFLIFRNVRLGSWRRRAASESAY